MYEIVTIIYQLYSAKTGSVYTHDYEKWKVQIEMDEKLFMMRWIVIQN